MLGDAELVLEHLATDAFETLIGSMDEGQMAANVADILCRVNFFLDFRIALPAKVHLGHGVPPDGFAYDSYPKIIHSSKKICKNESNKSLEHQ